MAALKVEFSAHMKTIFERLGLSSDFQNGKSNNKYVCTPFNLMIEITLVWFSIKLLCNVLHNSHAQTE